MLTAARSLDPASIADPHLFTLAHSHEPLVGKMTMLCEFVAGYTSHYARGPSISDCKMGEAIPRLSFLRRQVGRHGLFVTELEFDIVNKLVLQAA